ncbi:ABC transporter substrate-binding protein [Pseudodonghicola xiamenensis]|uniref:ABC transporter substrate-binding protein n=1 Tax=Pseudodonghicola xiamenensis TaxID=337702 RepID=A0A8J3H6R4_9RHOB|nr:ABC transporter substrate-binding protein [Pseudodonghicola xiamenensis]GHG85659.1 ABC transporter substrate-binding protein [Pseudodonghicola xiamenensis]
MKKAIKVALMAAVSLGLPGAAVARDLTIVGFGGGYQDSARETLFKGFAEATGIAVLDDVYNGEMAKIYGMVETGNVSWDVIMVEAPELVRGCEDGVFARIDYDVIDKSKFIAGSATDCGVGGTGWGAAMFYDQARHPVGPATFAQFWDLEGFPGMRAMRQGPKMTLEAALMADGVSMDQVYDVLSTDAGVDRAFAKLDEIKDHVIWWKSGAQPLQLVGSGEADYAFGYTGRIIRAQGEGRAYALNWNTLLYSIDSWAVVAGSPKRAEAMSMIDYITDAGPLRAQAALWPISPANKEVNADPALQEANPGMVLNHAEEGLFINTEFWIEHGDALEARFTAWAAQ